ncbi:MAG: 4Fe-4S binding protein [Eubacteriales bacterium]|nr:4Fe-4S binding protein [Eubacteriales bacterium]
MTIHEDIEYYVQSNCMGCGKCLQVCPENCIDISKCPAVIDQNACRHCGECREICPVGAVAEFD